jgi:hypothetical protein
MYYHTGRLKPTNATGTSDCHFSSSPTTRSLVAGRCILKIQTASMALSIATRAQAAPKASAARQRLTPAFGSPVARPAGPFLPRQTPSVVAHILGGGSDGAPPRGVGRVVHGARGPCHPPAAARPTFCLCRGLPPAVQHPHARRQPPHTASEAGPWPLCTLPDRGRFCAAPAAPGRARAGRPGSSPAPRAPNPQPCPRRYSPGPEDKKFLSRDEEPEE